MIHFICGLSQQKKKEFWSTKPKKLNSTKNIKVKKSQKHLIKIEVGGGVKMLLCCFAPQLDLWIIKQNFCLAFKYKVLWAHKHLPKFLWSFVFYEAAEVIQHFSFRFSNLLDFGLLFITECKSAAVAAFPTGRI